MTEDIELYSDCLQECIDYCGSRTGIIVGADVNAALGVQRRCHDRVLGRYEQMCRNDARKQLYQFLTKNELCVTTTIFDNKSNTGKTR